LGHNVLVHSEVLALADDLTGALEIGAKFAGAGISALVTADPAAAMEATVRVIDTETRHLGPAEASARIRHLACAAQSSPPRLIYKKTDSTLRGNIAAELTALAAVFPDSPLVYVPAYPRLGRTVRNGHLLVDGVPVHLTAFAQDPLNPIRESHIPTLLGAPGIHVRDAETDDEIRGAAVELFAHPGTLVAAGPAAFAEALAGCIRAPDPPPPGFRPLNRCLVINGSLHPVAARQIEAMQFDDRWRLFDHSAIPGEGLDRARAVGEAVRPLVPGQDGLIIFGGDTAFGILQALGGGVLRPLSEFLPGVPLSTLRTSGRDLILITKAGGFGAPDLLPALRRLLSNSQ
jgi:uncharacterized protein YgbK (DUF1537 family)